MVGNGAGWGIPASSPSICWITVGGIGHKGEDVGGQSTTRDCLSLTVSFDHNLVDGAPAARFTERFKELIESGYGLTLEEEAPTSSASISVIERLSPSGVSRLRWRSRPMTITRSRS
jgi:2-oxoacid dehydrogenases acyltransferase (catalytic domain)